MGKEKPQVRLRGITTEGWTIPVSLTRMALAAVAGFPLASWAFGVGDAELQSRYAQPLALRVPITLTDADRIVSSSELSVRLLPFSAYEGMGLSVPPLNPQSVNLEVTGSGQAYWVELRSTERVREPMMTLLLEVRLAGVRIIRELPILFDLPQAQSPVQFAAQPVIAVPPVQTAEPAPAVTAPAVAEVAPDIIARPLDVPVNAPTGAAPVALMEPAPVVQKPPRAVVRRAAPKKSKPVVKKAEPPPRTTFRLAEWNQSGAATRMSLPTFQLAERFDSYRSLSAAGTPPVPATQLAMPEVPARPLQLEASEKLAMPPVPAADTRSTELGWLWWTLLVGFVSAVASFLLGRRRAPRPAQVVSATSPAQVIAVSEPVVQQPVQPVAVSEVAAPVAEPVPPPVAVAPPEPVQVQAPVAPEPAPVPEPVAAAATPSAHADLRKRLAELVARSAGDVNLLRRAQLVSAYLDLNRMESAENLLAELEVESNGASRPKFTLIKG